MFSARDDIVLCIRRQRGEEGGITCYTHHQVTVLIRVFFGFQQRFTRNDVVLNMPTFVLFGDAANLLI